MDEKLYQVEFENQRSAPVRVEENGRTMLVLQPGQTAVIEAWDPSVMFARFSRVVYKRDGSVSVRENPEWRSPIAADRWTLDLLNADSDTMQSLRVNGEPTELYRGIPRTVPVDPEDPLIWYRRITFVEEDETVPHPRNPRYVQRVHKLRMKKTLRSKRDLRKIREEMAEVERQRAERAIARELPPDVTSALAGAEDAEV
jgi:hypothetical protein